MGIPISKRYLIKLSSATYRSAISVSIHIKLDNFFKLTISNLIIEGDFLIQKHKDTYTVHTDIVYWFVYVDHASGLVLHSIWYEKSRAAPCCANNLLMILTVVTGRVYRHCVHVFLCFSELLGSFFLQQILLIFSSWVCSCSYRGRTLKVASWQSG